MEIFHEMKKYHTGKSPEGHDLFSIPLKSDDDGMVGRECPVEGCEPKYFKISLTLPEKYQSNDLSQANIKCPYCGNESSMQDYFTQSQLDWLKSMIFRDAAKTIQDMFKDTFRPKQSLSKGMFSINISFKPGRLPDVRHYVEEKLKSDVMCENCGFKYAVYGISFYCPLCHDYNIGQHIESSIKVIKSLVDEVERIKKEKGENVGQQLLGNSLEDIVSLFEGFLKLIFIHLIKRKYSNEEAEKRIANIRNNFQRLEGAEEYFKNEFNYNLFDVITAQERELLQIQFLKRHVLTHNLGLIDQKYKEKSNVFERRGAELEIDQNEVIKSLDIIKHIVRQVVSSLF